MKEFPKSPDRFCVVDVGSTTTKAIFFEKSGAEWRFLRKEAPTTVEKPHEDVTVGVLRALRALEKESGERLVAGDEPAVPLLASSSAGGGLAMVVTGLVTDLTAETADRVALGAGAIVLEVIAMNDERTPYRKIEDLVRLRPDMVLLAGGFDADAVSGPVLLAELVREAGLRPKLSPHAKLPVVYAGNVNATGYVRDALGDEFLFYPVANVRPEMGRENPGPARQAIQELFMEHVMSQAPGFERLVSWVAAPVLPTPAAFGRILELAAAELGRNVLAIDIGGATTDVFTVQKGEVLRTVSANLGMSYSILNAAELSGAEPVLELYEPNLTATGMWNQVGNKHVNPTRLASSAAEMRTEWAIAVQVLRAAVRQHLAVARGAVERPEARLDISGLLRPIVRPKEEPERLHISGLEEYDILVGSGGIMSHSPRSAAAAMLLDALPAGGARELVVDRAFMFPHLGVLAQADPTLARELFFRLGTVRLGTAYAFAGGRLGLATGKGRRVEETVEPGTVRLVDLAEDETAELSEEAEPARTVRGGVCGLIIDARAGRVRTGVRSLIPEDYVPPGRDYAPEPEEQVYRGRLRLERELAIAGRVLVHRGERVKPDTVVGRSVRQFLRPFFLHVAEAIEVPARELGRYLVKDVGDEVREYDVIARRPRGILPAKVFRSPVAGRIEKVLSSGTLVVRESPEHARELTAVEVAKEMDIAPKNLGTYLKVRPGQEVERGQWLAARMWNGLRFVVSPVRGRVNRIDGHFGIVLIEPLLEEQEVRAWLPGRIVATSERGAVVESEATVLTGVWGRGGEAWGELGFGPAAPGRVMVRDFCDRTELDALRAAGVAALVAGGLNLEDVLEPSGPFTVVVLSGFGAREVASEMAEALRRHEGRLALVDGTTQLRVGVRRPRVILPENQGLRP